MYHCHITVYHSCHCHVIIDVPDLPSPPRHKVPVNESKFPRRQKPKKQASIRSNTSCGGVDDDDCDDDGVGIRRSVGESVGGGDSIDRDDNTTTAATTAAAATTTLIRSDTRGNSSHGGILLLLLLLLMTVYCFMIKTKQKTLVIPCNFFSSIAHFFSQCVSCRSNCFIYIKYGILSPLVECILFIMNCH